MGSAMNGQILVSLFAEDPISRAGLEAALRWQPQITLVDEESASVPTVAVVAADSIDERILGLLRSLRARSGSQILLVVEALSDADLLAVVEAGVRAIVFRFEATPARIAETVMRTASGEATLPSEVLSTLLKQVSRLQHHVLLPLGLKLNGLSEREADVLRLAAEGLDTGEIASKLCYSKRTVTNILHDVMSRFQLVNRTHAVAYAIREGLI
jgi:DNA-binding NarL/FixJ family response regulator